jgi:hypothetical protein
MTLFDRWTRISSHRALAVDKSRVSTRLTLACACARWPPLSGKCVSLRMIHKGRVQTRGTHASTLAELMCQRAHGMQV